MLKTKTMKPQFVTRQHILKPKGVVWLFFILKKAVKTYKTNEL